MQSNEHGIHLMISGHQKKLEEAVPEPALHNRKQFYWPGFGCYITT